MATYSNLFVDQGSNFTMTVDLVKSIGSLDLSDYSAAGSIAKSYDGTTKGTFTVSIDSTDSQLVLSLSAAETAALKPGRYVYDVIIKKTSDSSITRVLEGQLEVTPGVTFDVEAPETSTGAGNVSSHSSSGSSSSASTKSVFAKTLPVTSHHTEPSNDAYAFIKLDQGLYYNSGTNSSITLNIDLAETTGGTLGDVHLFLTTQTLVDNPIPWSALTDGYYSHQNNPSNSSSAPTGLGQGLQTVTLSINSLSSGEGTAQYLGIVFQETRASRVSSQNIAFEIKDLEITSFTHPNSNVQSIGFETKTVLNGNTVDTNTELAFDSISSSTGLFKS